MDSLQLLVIAYFYISIFFFIVLCGFWFTQLFDSTPPVQSTWYAPGTILSYTSSSRAIVINDNDVIIKMIDEKPCRQIVSLESWLESAKGGNIDVDFSIVKRLEELRRKTVISKHPYNLRSRK